MTLWQFNIAIVVDGSSSIKPSQWEDEKEFAKNVTNAFTKRNLFENGGIASYVQFDGNLESSGSFTSLEDFNIYVDNDVQGSGGDTNTSP